MARTKLAAKKKHDAAPEARARAAAARDAAEDGADAAPVRKKKPGEKNAPGKKKAGTKTVTASSPGEKKAGETKAGKTKAGKTKTGKTKAGEKKADRKKADRKKAGKKKVGKTKAGKKKAGKKKAGEKKADKKKAGEKKAGKKKAGKQTAGEKKAGKKKADKQTASKQTATKQQAGDSKTTAPSARRAKGGSRPAPATRGRETSTVARGRTPAHVEEARAGGADPLRVPGSLYTRVQDHTPKLLMGGAVRVPLERIARVARLAWFADTTSHPELRLDPPPGAVLPPWPAAGAGLVAAAEGESLRVAFGLPPGEDRGTWALGARGWLDEAGARLRELPEGAALELLAASLTDIDGPVLRCCGVLRQGAWEVLSTFPPLARSRLEEALALSADVDEGQRLAVDPAEADELLAWAEDEPHLFGDSALTGRADGVALERADPALLGAVARRLFRRRFAEVWPLADD